MDRITDCVESLNSPSVSVYDYRLQLNNPTGDYIGGSRECSTHGTRDTETIPS